MKFTTAPWYNCLAWAFSQLLGTELPCKYKRYVLNYRLPIIDAFEKKAQELGVNIKLVNSWDEFCTQESGFVVFGYFLEEIQEGYHTTYENSGFHVVLWNNKLLAHQNGCGVTPTITTMSELQKMGYTNPIFFAVTSNKQV